MEFLKKKVVLFVTMQLIIFVLMLLINKNVSLLAYINMSFFVGGTVLFIGLLIYVVSNGFFDIFTLSMRKVFTPKRNLADAESMRAPSELLDFPTIPFFQLGGTILLGMFTALFFYYSK